MTGTILLFQFVFQSSFCVGIRKNPRSCPGIVKIEQFSSVILKFSVKQVGNLVTLISSKVFYSLYLYLMQACVDLVLIILGTQAIKKMTRSVCVSRLFFRFFWICWIETPSCRNKTRFIPEWSGGICWKWIGN